MWRISALPGFCWVVNVGVVVVVVVVVVRERGGGGVWNMKV